MGSSSSNFHSGECKWDEGNELESPVLPCRPTQLFSEFTQSTSLSTNSESFNDSERFCVASKYIYFIFTLLLYLISIQMLGAKICDYGFKLYFLVRLWLF